MTVSGTTMVRRQLGRHLRRHREAAGKTLNDVTAAHLGSYTKIWRIERGEVEVKVATVRVLCDFYGVDQAEREQLEAMALGTGERGWWQEAYGDVMPEWFRLYVGLEEGAAQIAAWDDSLVPGLLQTAGYAGAVFGAHTDDPAEIDRHVGIRLARQRRILDRLEPPNVIAVIGEGALARSVGGPEVMAVQLAHLRELDKRPNIEVRVLPFTVGAHPAMTGAFSILDFTEHEDPDTVYVEALVGARYLEKPEELARYRTTWRTITSLSVPIGEHR